MMFKDQEDMYTVIRGFFETVKDSGKYKRGNEE